MLGQRAPVPLSAAQEWRLGWNVVLASFVGLSFLAVMTGSLSMFMEPVAKEFGWSRTLVSSGFTMGTAMSALLSPFFGVVIDRFGSRRVAIPGIAATALATAAFAFATGSATQWFVLWAVYAAISISVKTTVWTAAVAGRFRAGQGLALGITLCGGAATQTILPPLTNWLIDSFGWRAAYAWLGIGWGGLALIVAWLFLHDGRRAPGSDLRVATASTERREAEGLSIREAWRDTALWRIMVSTFLIMLFTVGLAIHQIAILREAGVSREYAALLAGAGGLAAVLGKLMTGFLLDRFRPNWVGGLTLSVTALAFALLVDGIHSAPLIIFAMLVGGYSQGTKLQIASYLTARYAGMRNFGAIFGVMNSVMAAGSGLGPLLAGVIYDLSSGYGYFLLAGAIGSIVSGVLLMGLPAYPDNAQ